LIDPLRPYWPANRSLGGLLFRTLALTTTGIALALGPSRRWAVAVVVTGAAAQAAFVMSEWMYARGAGVMPRILLALAALGLVPLAAALVIEAGHVLQASVR
jgi:hypothetical protein